MVLAMQDRASRGNNWLNRTWGLKGGGGWGGEGLGGCFSQCRTSTSQPMLAGSFVLPVLWHGHKQNQYQIVFVPFNICDFQEPFLEHWLPVVMVVLLYGLTCETVLIWLHLISSCLEARCPYGIDVFLGVMCWQACSWSAGIKLKKVFHSFVFCMPVCLYAC